LRDSLRRGLAPADELSLMTKFGKHRIEHDAAERIVFDAENAQPPHMIWQAVGIQPWTCRFRRLGAGQRHRQGKRGTAAAPRRYHDVAAHRPRELFDRRQSEARAAKAVGDADIGLGKRTEQALDLLKRQADAAIGNHKRDANLAPRAAGRLDCQRDAALLGEFGCVVDQVFQCRAQANRIADHECRKFLRNLDKGLQSLGRCPAGQGIADVAGERAQIEKVLPHAKAGTAAPGGIDKQCRETCKVFGARLDRIDPAPLALVQVGRRQ